MNEGPERIDYRETSDVTEVHAAIQREHGDPSAAVTPIPLWLSAVCATAICWAGAYLGVFHSGFSADVYNEYESSPSVLFPSPSKKGGASSAAVAEISLAKVGKGIFGQNCQVCHQPTGLGLAGVNPPLVKSEYVIGGEKRLVAILLKGIQGPLVVEGKPYNGAMPAWEGSLSDKKIAAVASYIRSEWGNAAPEISEAAVAAGRKEFVGQAAPWSEAQLLQIPADATFGIAAAAPAAAAPAPAAGAAPVAAAAPAAGAVDPAVMEKAKPVT